MDSDATLSSLTVDDVIAARRQLSEAQSTVRETLDRLRQSQEENEMITRRRDELEGRLSTLEAEYEELLGQSGGYALICLFTPLMSRENHSR